MSGELISLDWVESEVKDLTGEQLQAFVDEWHGKASGIFASSSVGNRLAASTVTSTTGRIPTFGLTRPSARPRSTWSQDFIGPIPATRARGHFALAYKCDRKDEVGNA